MNNQEIIKRLSVTQSSRKVEENRVNTEERYRNIRSVTSNVIDRFKQFLDHQIKEKLGISTIHEFALDLVLRELNEEKNTDSLHKVSMKTTAEYKSIRGNKETDVLNGGFSLQRKVTNLQDIKIRIDLAICDFINSEKMPDMFCVIDENGRYLKIENPSDNPDSDSIYEMTRIESNPTTEPRSTSKQDIDSIEFRFYWDLEENIPLTFQISTIAEGRSIGDLQIYLIDPDKDIDQQIAMIEMDSSIQRKFIMKNPPHYNIISQGEIIYDDDISEYSLEIEVIYCGEIIINERRFFMYSRNVGNDNFDINSGPLLGEL